MNSNQKRYEEILRNIANRDQTPQLTEVESELKDTLNQLNVLDEIGRISKQSFHNVICYRPRLFEGNNWCGILTWYHKKGYRGYQNLTIFGVWLVQSESDVTILIGERTAGYKPVVFNPDSYYKLIRKGFYTYYQDRGQPPVDQSEQISIFYDPKKRIEIRKRLKDLVDEQIIKIASL